MFRAIAGNFFTKAWTALLGIVAVPFLPRFLGPEAFGIVSFVLVIQSAVNLLDFGLSNSITRQVALHRAAGERNACIATIRSLEIVYWAIGVLICGALVAGSQFAGTFWLHPQSLPQSTVQHSLFWASLAVASLWPLTFYSGALMGLARYAAANVVNGGSLTLRQLGGIVVAWLTGGNLVAFFVWQFIASSIPVLLAAGLVWRASGVQMRSRIEWHSLRQQKGLLGGMAISTGMMLVFTQLDKIVLSRLLPLSEFGLYSIAWTAAGIFSLFYSPVAAIGLPRFTTFIARRDRKSLLRSYHLASQVVGVGVIPTAIVLALFARPILGFWLHDRAMAESTARLLEILGPFAAIGALAYIPAVFQWAHGWTSPTSITNLLASALLGPFLFLAYRAGGTRVAILAWGLLRLGQALWQVAWAHRRLLPNESVRWAFRSVLNPALISLGICFAGRQWLSPEPNIFILAALWLAAASASAFAAVEVRSVISFNLGRLPIPAVFVAQSGMKTVAGQAHGGHNE